MSHSTSRSVQWKCTALAVAGDRLSCGEQREQLEVLVDTVGRDVGVDRAELTLRELGVAAVDHGLVRLAPRPEPHDAGPGEGPDRRVFGRGRERVGEILAAGAHPLEAVVARREPGRPCAEKSGGSVDLAVHVSGPHPVTLPMWWVRSSTVQAGHDGTGAVEAGFLGRVAESVDVRSDRCDVGVVVHRRRLGVVPALRDCRGMRFDAGVTDIPTVRNETALGYGAVVLVVFLWGIGPLFVRAVDAGALTIATARNWIAVPVALGIAWLARTPLTWRWLRLAIPGGVAFAIAQTLGFASFHEDLAGHRRDHRRDHTSRHRDRRGAAVRGAVDREADRADGGGVRGSVRRRASVPAAVATRSLFGDLLAFGSLFAMTAYLLLMKQARMTDVPASAYVAGVFLVCAVVVTPVELLWGDSLSAITGVDWVWIFLLAVFAGCLGHTFMTWAQKHVNVGVASIMVLGTTIVTSAGAWIFFDQALNAVQILGGFVVLAGLGGVLLLQLSDPYRPPEVPFLVELAEPPTAE